MQTAKLIANPAAGRGRVAQCLEDIQAALKSLSVETDLVRTQAPGQAVDVAAPARTMLLSYRTPPVTIGLDGATSQQRITLLTVGNGRCSGGSFWLTPDALLDDGLFDVCIARGMSKPQILALVPHVMKGTHVNKPAVRMARAAHITIQSEQPLPVHADGEILYTGAHELDVTLLPQT